MSKSCCPYHSTGGDLRNSCGGDNANPHKNWNCSGDRCTSPHGEVRLYPYGGGANGIYCASCWAHENRYRAARGRETGRPQDWPQLNWSKAEVYLPE